MKTVVLLSGGLDSTVLLARQVYEFSDVVALSINYEQKHARELQHARKIAQFYDVPHGELSIPTLWALAKSSQVGAQLPVPHGHYADENMKTTIVPNRNMVLLACAGAYALSIDAEILAYAAHAGDHTIYPDCRPQFVTAMQAAFELCDWKKLTLSAPFLGYTKADIVRIGNSLHVPFELTWSCYDPQKDKHCGQCGTCVERQEAFKLAGIDDPTQYTTPTDWSKA